ncbi:DUF4184 family protein [Microbacterium sp.]|uniref:DUF4184 family protein n=1 Tax=Microbacterium sp. TaxID=51671 RepID=UPI0033403882
MPLTPAHAIVALPFLRTPLVPAAVAIGAMTPDLPLFIPGLTEGSEFTHSTANVVWTTVIAAVLYALWRMLLRPASVELLPGAISRRLPVRWQGVGAPALREAFLPSSRFGPSIVVLALLLGVLSHLLWDSFTHTGRRGVEFLPGLKEMWGPLTGYSWMQYLSSFGGLLVLAIALIVWVRRTPVGDDPRTLSGRGRLISWLTLPALLVIAWLIGVLIFGPPTSAYAQSSLAYRTLPPACGIWTAGSAVFWAIRRRRRAFVVTAAAERGLTDPTSIG